MKTRHSDGKSRQKYSTGILSAGFLRTRNRGAGPAPHPLRRGTKPNPRRTGARSGKTAEHTPEPATDGFLNYVFSALVCPGEVMEEQQAIEAAFWPSLQTLSDTYGWAWTRGRWNGPLTTRCLFAWPTRRPARF